MALADMFIADVLNVIVDVGTAGTQTGALASLEDAPELIAYAHGHYYTLGRELGHFGFSFVRSPEKGRQALNPAMPIFLNKTQSLYKIWGKRQIYF